MTADFAACFKLLLGNEGGYTVDNGGPTRWGITQRVARANGYAGDMRVLPVETAQSIAKAEYWDKFGCGLLPTAVAFQVFDTAYNGGHPIQWLQAIVGTQQDGVLGEQTAIAVGRMDVWEVLARFNAKRLRYLASLRQPVSADGRMNRIADNLERGGLE